MLARRSTFVVLGTFLAMSLLASQSPAASPTLGNIMPRGVQRGTEAVMTLGGGRLADAQEVLYFSPGFEVTKIEAAAGSVKATVKIAPDCRLGEHALRVRTASGITEMRTFFVGALPAVDEAEPNSDFETPQKIEPNVTVTGVVQNEDVDYYAIEAKKGQRISAEIEAMRLGTTLFDAYVAIMDSKRFELSADDDTPLVFQDAVASIVAPEDGTYYVQVRESSYGGNGNCRYRLHVGNFPRPTAVYPAGGKLGEEVEVSFLGDPAGELKQKIKLPAEPDRLFGVLAANAGGISSSPNPFRLFEHGNVLEAEPNNEYAAASPAELPLAFNGIIGETGDVDCFRFKGTKGQVFEVECYARRIRSPLDPIMSIHRADGGRITANDDSRGPDSYFRFNTPADGEYILRVTDHLGRGGGDFVYRVEFAPVKPSLSLTLPTVRRYAQDRQVIIVPKGNRYCTMVNLGRSNFGGEVILEAKDLPTGITMSGEPVPANLSSFPVLFEAAADAPVAGKLLDFTGRHADPAQKITAVYSQTADLIRGGPGQSIYWRHTIHQMAVAVVDEVPFTLEIVEPKVPVVRNGSMQLKIVAHRKEGFTAPINVQFPFRPPGIGAASSVNIPEGKSEVLYPLNANANAQIKEWKVFALGSANAGGTVWVSSQLAKLEIAAPYVTFAIERAACEQGQETEIICKIKTDHPFEGAAQVKLVGLPAKVTTEPMEFNKETAEVAFKVVTDKTSPAGKHNVYCQVVITDTGEPVFHSVGGTQLQIDKPLPPKVAAPAPKPKPMPAAVAKKEEPKKPARGD